MPFFFYYYYYYYLIQGSYWSPIQPSLATGSTSLSKRKPPPKVKLKSAALMW